MNPFKNRTAKEKGIKKENNGKHGDYYNSLIALMDNKERIVEDCRVKKSWGLDVNNKN